MMTLVTAAGCSVTALVAAFLSAAPDDPLFAAAAALSVFGCAPGSAPAAEERCRRALEVLLAAQARRGARCRWVSRASLPAHRPHRWAAHLAPSWALARSRG